MSEDKLTVVFTKRAAEAIERANAWWLDNRSAAPHAVVEEVTGATELISLQPAVGARAANARLKRVRRVLLSRIGYHLYYCLRPRLRRIDVLDFWHARRREPGP